MKTITQPLKKIVLITCLFILTITFSSQAQSETYKGFLRVYSQTGEKIASGRFNNINDSLVSLKKGKSLTRVDYRNIGFMKTKRSGGNNVVVGAAAGATLGVILGVGTADASTWYGYSAGEGALVFGALGALGGGVLGGLVGLAKEPLHFTINGNQQNWLEVKTFLNGTKN